jgi:drug/metabolite transporter (DMT)-like permease
MRTPSATPASLTRGYAAALAAAGILSTTAIFIRYLTQNYRMPALVLASWRDILVALTLALALIVLRPALARIQRQDAAFILAYGLMVAVFNSLWTISVAVNGAAISTVLVYCSAGFTALLGWWLLKEHLDWARLLAIAVCLGGCVLVSGALEPGAMRSNLVGVLTGLLSGLAYAGFTLFGRYASRRGLNPWTSVLYSFGLGGVFIALIAILSGGRLPGTIADPADFMWLGSSLAGWGILLLLAAGPTLAGFGMYNTSLTYLPSSVVNLIMTLEPVFTILIAYVLLGERLNLVQIAGSLLILAGIVFLRLYSGRATEEETKSLFNAKSHRRQEKI